MPATVAPSPQAPAVDPRIAAFCAPAGPEVFGGAVHGSQIWSADPFDVESVHAEARETFTRLVNRASSLEPPQYGKSLLLRGEAGSGKTHLMRAFRAIAHTAGAGYCGYMQMRTRTDNYARYVLSNLISSLEQPYKLGSPQTGLNRLARGLLDALDMIPAEDRQRLCSDLLEPDDVARLVFRFADAAVQYPQFRGIDVNVLRAILFLLSNDGRIRPRVLNWLRCEDLSRYDREPIGDLVPRPQPEKPMETILDLGRLMRAVHKAALVLLVDQVDETLSQDGKDDDPGEQFRATVKTLLDVTDKLPGAIVVVGCLEDVFSFGRPLLPRWALDRLEKDPEPIRLSGKLSSEQIAEIVGRRLNYFFDEVDVEFDPACPFFPFTGEDLALLNGLQTRVVLEQCLRHRINCIAAGKLVPIIPNDTEIQVQDLNWERRWNDFLSNYAAAVIDDEPKLAQLLAFTIRTVSAEMPNGVHFGVDPDDRFVPVEIHTGNAVDKLLVAVCDKSTRGGGLGRQVEEVATLAREIPAVFVRSTAFPSTPSAVVSKELARLTAPRGKGRKVVIENSDWRAMAAFKEFHTQHHAAPGFAEWQRSEKPLSELRSIHTILALDRMPATPTPPPVEKPPSPPPRPAGLFEWGAISPPLPSRHPVASIRLGQVRGATPSPVEFQPSDFCKHAAFVGGSGSGKTTAALTIIEQLLQAGIPAILIDRKGDLSRYADPEAWGEDGDPDRTARRSQLRAVLDVALYTPGDPNGRPLAIPVAPPNLASLPTADRDQLAGFAAANLGRMMAYRGRSPDPKVVILKRAIEVLSQVPGQAVTVRGLQQLVNDRDETLTGAFEGYEDKHYKKLSEELLTLTHHHRRLLEEGEPLDIDTLLGRGPAAQTGRTRLTIINTQFLGDSGTIDFWLSQFLLALNRWRAQNPSPDGRLQATFLFDEADQYLPAGAKQPATKGPMEDLLRRARSAGMGLFLATQSPGDFDYKCRDQVSNWLIGRVKETVAINKLRPMLEAAKVDAASRLPGQLAGQFYLARETGVTSVQAERNLISANQLREDRILALARESMDSAKRQAAVC